MEQIFLVKMVTSHYPPLVLAHHFDDIVKMFPVLHKKGHFCIEMKHYKIGFGSRNCPSKDRFLVSVWLHPNFLPSQTQGPAVFIPKPTPFSWGWVLGRGLHGVAPQEKIEFPLRMARKKSELKFRHKNEHKPKLLGPDICQFYLYWRGGFLIARRPTSAFACVCLRSSALTNSLIFALPVWEDPTLSEGTGRI